MRYRDEDIEKLLNLLRIEEVVGEVVELKKTGSNYKGLCPFHTDNSPSFMVSPQKNISKCFVCGSGGNPITFYMKYHSIDFGDAIAQLAKKYNIDIKPLGSSNRAKDQKYERLYSLMTDAQDYFARLIFENDGREAIEYLYKRGFKVEFIKENYIGYAGRSWDDIIIYMEQKGYKVEELIEVGLIKEGTNGYYSTFRNRIIFPIKNISGKVVAFGGRSLEEGSGAKYLNSPETIIFHKRKNLYGMKEKGSLIKKKSYAIIMEGYLDVLKAQSYGFDVALAPLGTAFTEEQAELLRKFTSNVIIAYDMDTAGRKAVEKTSFILKEKGFNIRVLEYKDAKDPDEFLTKFGREKFLECVRESKEIFDFIYGYYARNYDLKDLIAKQNFINSFKEFFVSLENELEKNLYLDKLSNNLDIDKGILYKELIENNKKIPKKNYNENYNDDFLNFQVKKSNTINKLEKESLQVLLNDFSYANFLNEKAIESSLLNNVIKIILQDSLENSKDLLESEKLSEEERQNLFDYFTLTSDSNSKKDNNLKLETTLGWFRKELKESLDNARKNKAMTTMLELKKIEIELGNSALDELFVKNLYKYFKKIILGGSQHERIY